MENDLLARVYRQYSREIRLYLYVLSKNETLAEDLTQETFLKALLSLPAEHPNVRAWLYTVARNLYYDSRKKDRRIVNDEISDREDDVHPGPEDTILASERDRALMRAVTELEERKREIVQLHYFSGVPLKDAAALTGLTPENARVLLFRAKKELRIKMEALGYDIP
ncbi:MAG: RNA polymerase sigma factor [Clostridia bacterium]|nr:RNA polymerase sigma factor [Clostridia bacterium]